MTPARSYAKGIGDAVADRTINRKIEFNGETRVEKWEDVARRVAAGSVSLAGLSGEARFREFDRIHHHLRQASILMSGRHLQHGDENQHTRNMEVFTNCGRGDTELLTLEHGVTTLEKIADKTVTVRCSDGQWRSAEAKAYGEQQLYRMVFARAGTGPKTLREVFFTKNHRWLLADGTVTDAIQVGDVLKSMPVETCLDDEGVIHGLIFGDGSAHKRRRDSEKAMASQGRTYASLRVCKQDSVKDEILERIAGSGYEVEYPEWANGDAVCYFGKIAFAKELPYSRDPEYLAGFIRGWWLADGNKSEPNGTWTISTADEVAARWLTTHAGYAGLSVISCIKKERKEGDGSFPNGKPLFIVRLRQDVKWVLQSMEPYTTEVVYCVEEPITKSFTLANGIVTGNCSTSAASFLTFYLLLNGSGVGRSYDDAMIVADLNNLPIVVPAIDMSHKDVLSGEINALDRRNALHLYADRECVVFEVPDSREGWAKALEKMELMAFEGTNRDKVLILDFSKVRPRGAPIGGMQGRPASGPGPLMAAIKNVAALREAGMAPWRAAMYADHYLAECVLVGGARRAARMATKFWKDPTVLDFIQVKRGGFLWSSNNSVTVDDRFWHYVKMDDSVFDLMSPECEDYRLGKHAKTVFDKLTEAAYFDQTGEPGIISVDKLTWNDEGVEVLLDGNFAESERYKLEPETLTLTSALAKAWLASEYKVITNPCGEIVLGSLGGYCVIADIVPFHATTDDDAEDAFRTATRALIRTNTMDCLYGKEVKRTNRIGVGITGLHEYAWSRFGYGFRDIIDEDKSKDFWLMLARFKRAVQDEAKSYATELGVAVPHTNTTMKPAGTTSKLFGLTEGAHLASMREYLRWVQFRNDDPLIAEYEAQGYPVRKLQTYSGTTIVGFPTQPLICSLGMGDKLVTAAEATPEEQYQYLRLLEKYWIVGVKEDGKTPLEDRGNQVSYTLKYDPRVVSFEDFKRTLLEGQSTIRCCSVMPQTDTSAYEYQPEQPVTKHEFELIAAAIAQTQIKEDIGLEHVDCSTGACPIDFRGAA